MNKQSPIAPRRSHARLRLCGLLAVAAVSASFALHAQLPAQSPSPSKGPLPGSTLGSTAATPWNDLSARQRTALQPLQHSWNEIAPDHQQKWLEIATRFPALPAQEQTRIQARMTEWAQMSPQERGRARLRFQEAKRLPPTDRQARWEEFQALTPEQRHELSERAAAQAARNAAAPAASGSAARLAAERRAASSETASTDTRLKAHSAADSGRAVREEAIAPAIVQAKPGVTTTLMSKRTLVAQHPKAGTPKIAAASDSINAVTLLPRKAPTGPVGARPVEAMHEPDGAGAGEGAVATPASPRAEPAPRPSMEMPNPEFYK